MAKTRPCPACGEPIATATLIDPGPEKCPHCGRRTAFGNVRNWITFAATMAVVLFFLRCLAEYGGR